jgi:hypothetical protein
MKLRFLDKIGGKYMDYVKGKGYYVGCFDENDIANKLDKKALEKAKEETGLKYTNQEIVYKNKKPVGIKLYVCDLKAMKI